MKSNNKRLTSRNSAKTIVDTIFDASLFREDITRDQMNTIEELVDVMMKSFAKSWTNSHIFLEKMKKLENRHNSIDKN